MDQLTTLKDYDLPVTLYNATVIHANKFSRADGAFSYFVFSSLHTDIVFRMSDTNDDIPVYVSNLDLPIYSGEEVMIVVIAKIVVAYIDSKTNQYYYLSNNLGKTLGMGIAFYWVWLAALLMSLMIFFIQPTFSAWCIIPFIGAWLFLLLQRLILHSRLRNRIDQVLSGR